ncbi:transposase [Candidatus Roizmanbacteria bacterium]|nr:transposase [Candidatus Roizmanbacteria bacterium]
MPNHFHFIIRQKNKSDMTSFMRSIMTKYIHYFNEKYKRVGPLFQSKYKAVLINKEEYILHLTRYIHLNPKKIMPKKADLSSYSWSSYPTYVKNWNSSWLTKDLIMSYFNTVKGFGFSSYQGFVEGYRDDTMQKDTSINNLFLE